MLLTVALRRFRHFSSHDRLSPASSAPSVPGTTLPPVDAAAPPAEELAELLEEESI